MVKVDFMIIGAARSATTSLSNILGSHPDICFSKIKEPQFFSQTDWRNQLDSYHELFSENSKLCGEGSTNYTKYPAFNNNIHSDIFEYNPDMKFIYIMRHPIDRIISHYKFALERGYTNEDINKAVLENPIYLNTSKYYSQIKKYVDVFDKDQITLVLFDDYKNNPQQVTDELCQFLNLNKQDVSASKIYANKSQTGRITHKKYDHPKTLIDKLAKAIHLLNRKLFNNTKDINLSVETKNILLSSLKNDTQLLENYLGLELSRWQK